MTLEGQANPIESRKRRTELWESAPGDGMSGGVAKDGGKIRSLTESVRDSDRKIV